MIQLLKIYTLLQWLFTSTYKECYILPRQAMRADIHIVLSMISCKAREVWGILVPVENITLGTFDGRFVIAFKFKSGDILPSGEVTVY